MEYIDQYGNRHIESDGKNDPIIVYAWRVRDPKRWRGWRELTYKMTKEAAAEWAVRNGAEIEVIEGSEEARVPL